jgi:hypothetical protein
MLFSILLQARMKCLCELGWRHIIDRLEAEKEVSNYYKYLPF